MAMEFGLTFSNRHDMALADYSSNVATVHKFFNGTGSIEKGNTYILLADDAKLEKVNGQETGKVEFKLKLKEVKDLSGWEVKEIKRQNNLAHMLLRKVFSDYGAKPKIPDFLEAGVVDGEEQDGKLVAKKEQDVFRLETGLIGKSLTCRKVTIATDGQETALSGQKAEPSKQEIVTTNKQRIVTTKEYEKTENFGGFCGEYAFLSACHGAKLFPVPEKNKNRGSENVDKLNDFVKTSLTVGEGNTAAQVLGRLYAISKWLPKDFSGRKIDVESGAYKTWRHYLDAALQTSAAVDYLKAFSELVFKEVKSGGAAFKTLFGLTDGDTVPLNAAAIVSWVSGNAVLKSLEPDDVANSILNNEQGEASSKGLDEILKTKVCDQVKDSCKVNYEKVKAAIDNIKKNCTCADAMVVMNHFAKNPENLGKVIDLLSNKDFVQKFQDFKDTSTDRLIVALDKIVNKAGNDKMTADELYAFACPTAEDFPNPNVKTDMFYAVKRDWYLEILESKSTTNKKVKKADAKNLMTLQKAENKAGLSNDGDDGIGGRIENLLEKWKTRVGTDVNNVIDGAKHTGKKNEYFADAFLSACNNAKLFDKDIQGVIDTLYSETATENRSHQAIREKAKKMLTGIAKEMLTVDQNNVDQNNVDQVLERLCAIFEYLPKKDSYTHIDVDSDAYRTWSDYLVRAVKTMPQLKKEGKEAVSSILDGLEKGTETTAFNQLFGLDEDRQLHIGESLSMTASQKKGLFNWVKNDAPYTAMDITNELITDDAIAEKIKKTVQRKKMLTKPDLVKGLQGFGDDASVCKWLKGKLVDRVGAVNAAIKTIRDCCQCGSVAAMNVLGRFADEPKVLGCVIELLKDADFVGNFKAKGTDRLIMVLDKIVKGLGNNYSGSGKLAEVCDKLNVQDRTAQGLYEYARPNVDDLLKVSEIGDDDFFLPKLDWCLEEIENAGVIFNEEAGAIAKLSELAEKFKSSFNERTSDLSRWKNLVFRIHKLEYKKQAHAARVAIAQVQSVRAESDADTALLVAYVGLIPSECRREAMTLIDRFTKDSGKLVASRGLTTEGSEFLSDLMKNYTWMSAQGSVDFIRAYRNILTDFMERNEDREDWFKENVTSEWGLKYYEMGVLDASRVAMNHGMETKWAKGFDEIRYYVDVIDAYLRIQEASEREVSPQKNTFDISKQPDYMWIDPRYKPSTSNKHAATACIKHRTESALKIGGKLRRSSGCYIGNTYWDAKKFTDTKRDELEKTYSDANFKKIGLRSKDNADKLNGKYGALRNFCMSEALAPGKEAPGKEVTDEEKQAFDPIVKNAVGKLAEKFGLDGKDRPNIDDWSSLLPMGDFATWVAENKKTMYEEAKNALIDNILDYLAFEEVCKILEKEVGWSDPDQARVVLAMVGAGDDDGSRYYELGLTPDKDKKPSCVKYDGESTVTQMSLAPEKGKTPMVEMRTVKLSA